MQSRLNVGRSACKARNAYSQVLALRAAFGTSASCLKDDDHIPSTWETPPPINLPSSTAKYAPNSSVVGNGANAGANRDSAGPGFKKRRRGSKSRKPNIRHNPNGGQEHVAPRIVKHDIWDPSTRPNKPDDNLEGAEKAINFVGHTSWKQHMSQVREDAMRTQHVQWWEGEKSRPFREVKRFLDYDAAIIQPEPSKMDKPIPLPWAVNEVGRRHYTINNCLSTDINRFAAWIKPTSTEQRAREAVIEETKEIIRKVLHPSTTGVELFGSEKNGIALPFSDIDLRIYDVKDPNMPHFRLMPRLTRISTAMHASDKFFLATVRASGHPILNCQHRESGIDIQIVAANDSKPQQETVTKYIHHVPHLREVYYLVRTMLSMRGLVDVYTGGMGSYGTFTLVLAILARNMKYQKVTPGSGKTISSASQLIAFLEFYRHLDTRKLGVAVHPQTLFKKHESTNEALKAFSTLAEKRGDLVRAGQWELCVKRPFQPYLLCLQDPADPLNDLGKKTHAFKHIQATLTYLNQALAAGCVALRRWKSSDRDGSSAPESLLTPLVGRCHEVYSERRRKLEAYGEKLEKLELEAADEERDKHMSDDTWRRKKAQNQSVVRLVDHTLQ